MRKASVTQGHEANQRCSQVACSLSLVNLPCVFSFNFAHSWTQGFQCFITHTEVRINELKLSLTNRLNLWTKLKEFPKWFLPPSTRLYTS